MAHHSMRAASHKQWEAIRNSTISVTRTSSGLSRTIYIWRRLGPPARSVTTLNGVTGIVRTCVASKAGARTNKKNKPPRHCACHVPRDTIVTLEWVVLSNRNKRHICQEVEGENDE